MSNVNDNATLERLGELANAVRGELSKVIVGQQQAIDLILIALLARGHCVLVGVPGLAKTLIVRTFASVLELAYSRVQFTPDLMPSDITGTDVLVQDQSTGGREFRFIRGPVFANIVLADEINRAPPKTQSALLEAMQERQVTIGAAMHPLPDPFIVLATQNPIEQEGTYPLPEAQLDRFMFAINLQYPSEQDELAMLLKTTSDRSETIDALMHGSDIIEFQHAIRRIEISEAFAAQVLQIVRLTRPAQDNPLDVVNQCVTWGAGPRAGQFLILAAKTAAALRGSPLVTQQDLLHVISPTLEHRLNTNFTAEAKNLSAGDIVKRVIDFVVTQTHQKANRSGVARLLRS